MMISLTILVCILQLSFEASHPDKMSGKCMKCICGNTAFTHKGDDMDYVKGGEDSDQSIANFVLVVYNLEAGLEGGPKKCGGSIITSKHILTSAHCLLDESRKPPSPTKDLKKLTVFLSVPFNTRNVTKIVLKDTYDPKTDKDDLAILTLNKEIMFEEEEPKLSPICLPSIMPKYSGKEAATYGYGQTENESRLVSLTQAQVANVTVRTDDYCMADGTGWKLYDKEKELCAGDSTYTICKGDDGGPLVMVEKMRYTLIGVATMAQECYNFQGGLVGLYQKVYAFKKWIQENAPGAQDSNCDWM